MVGRGGFEYRGDHVVCPQGKVLKRAGYHRRNASYQYVASQKDCQACPVKEQCLPPGQKRRYLGLTIYYPLHLQAQERNQTPVYRREMARRRTIVVGSLCIPGSAGVGKVAAERIVKKPAPAKAGVDCEGFMASIAHNVLKAVRRLDSDTGPPGSDNSGGYAQFQSPVSSGERCPSYSRPSTVGS